MAKLWRRLHFFSTVIAGLFILLASITGCILAVEPWFLSQNAVSGSLESDLTLPDFQKKLNDNFAEVFSFEKDAYGNIKVEGIGLEKEGSLYVSAETGHILEAPQKLSAVFDWNRDLHRSLFLKTPGRILMGLASLGLVFLTISGIGLHIKRAGSLKGIFKTIRTLEIKRDGHAQLSRWLLIPIFIIALSGVYLSVTRFVPVAKKQEIAVDKNNNTPLSILPLKEVKKVTYPVMDDEFLVVELVDKVLYFDKAQTRLVKIERLPLGEKMQKLSFLLHTGEGTTAWAGILLLSSLVMVFLSGTGFMMVVEKIKQKKPKTQIHEEAETLILVGSETGHTWRFADALAAAFQKQGIKTSTLGMDNLPVLNGSKTLLCLTSTYGAGDAPENAQSILGQIQAKTANADHIQFSVLGFGARQYPEFCAFAEKLRNGFAHINNAQEITPYMTVDNQSVVQFIDWVKVLNKSQNTLLQIDLKQLQPARKKRLEAFKIRDKKECKDTFLLKIAHSNKLTVQTGDLLAVYPPNENVERYYSIASMNSSELILVIKRTGLCSNYLGNLRVNETFEGYIKPNPTFYRPSSDKPLLMIANGTGIAPFLGSAAKGKLYWGGRERADFDLFQDFTDFNSVYLAFSREKEKAYVQDLMKNRAEEVADVLKSKGTIMICGSLAMLAGVSQQLEIIATSHHLPSVEALKKQGRVLVDCY
ncbi:MAG: PepSY domain-containing protein [Saprospiraceae bacterium]|nr:PepSY domain-containing protein [Saprospiraceae bacterium]